MISAAAVTRLILLYDSGEYLDTEDITPLIEAARMWLREEMINGDDKYKDEFGVEW